MFLLWMWSCAFIGAKNVCWLTTVNYVHRHVCPWMNHRWLCLFENGGAPIAWRPDNLGYSVAWTPDLRSSLFHYRLVSRSSFISPHCLCWCIMFVSPGWFIKSCVSDSWINSYCQWTIASSEWQTFSIFVHQPLLVSHQLANSYFLINWLQ